MNSDLMTQFQKENKKEDTFVSEYIRWLEQKVLSGCTDPLVCKLKAEIDLIEAIEHNDEKVYISGNLYTWSELLEQKKEEYSKLLNA